MSAIFSQATRPSRLMVLAFGILLAGNALANDPIDEAEGIVLNTDQIAALGLKLTEIQPVEQVAGYAWPGMVDIPLAHRDMLSAPVAGRIDDIMVVHGEVRKDQPIMVLESTELVRLQQDYLSTLSALHEARQAFLRAQRLRTAGSVSEKQYLAAKTRFDTLRNQKTALRDQLIYSGLNEEQISALEKDGKPVRRLVLRAPKDGLLFDLQVERNQRVAADQLLAHIGEFDEVIVDVDVPYDSLSGIQIGSRAQIAETAWRGTVAFVNRQADPQTQRVTVHVRFDNNQRQLLPGQFVRVQFINDQLPGQLVYKVPSRALVAGENGETIAFVKQDNRFVPQPVEVIYRDDRNAIVSFGADTPATAQVVTFGAIFLKGMMEEDEGHEEGGGH